jgi:hypothetical protein
MDDREKLARLAEMGQEWDNDTTRRSNGAVLLGGAVMKPTDDELETGAAKLEKMRENLDAGFHVQCEYDAASLSEIAALSALSEGGEDTAQKGGEATIAGYTGPITAGMEFIWEPDMPHARQHIVVTRVAPIAGDETRIWSHEVDQPPATAYWNDESRFREAATPAQKGGE